MELTLHPPFGWSTGFGPLQSSGDRAFAESGSSKATLSGRRLQGAAHCPQVGDNLGRVPYPKADVGRKPNVAGESSQMASWAKALEAPGRVARRWKAPRVSADPDPLRGRSGEAALGPVRWSGLRKRTGLLRAGRACALSVALRKRGSARDAAPRPDRRPRESGSCGGYASPTLFRESRVRAAGSGRRRVRTRLRSQGRSAVRENGRTASRSIGVSSRCSRGSVTRGVRVDRVGAKLRHRVSRSRDSQAQSWHSQRRVSTEAPGGTAGRPLARETSAGVAWKAPRAVRKDREGR